MRKGGNSTLLSPHYVPLVRIFMSVFPFSPGSWHLLNAWCSEPLRNTVLNKQNKTSTSVLKQLPFQRGIDTAHSSGTQGESGDAGGLGEVPGVLPEKTVYKCKRNEKPRMRIFDFAGGATGTSSRRNAGGKATWGEPGREAQELSLGGLWGLQRGATGGSGASRHLQGWPGLHLFH